MGISLNGLTPANTYVALLKIGENEFLTTSLQVISDGLGNDSPLKLSTTAVGVGDIVDLEVAINGKQNALSIDANEGLALTGDALGTVYNTTIGDTVQSIAVGGAPAQAASIWKGLTLVQALDTILFPTLLASIQTAKSVVLTVSGASGLQEIGQTISRTLTATFNRGRIKNGDNTTGPLLVGDANLYTFSGTGISPTQQVGNTLAVSNTIVSGANNWAVTVAHDAGTGDYFDNKGNVGTNLDGSRVAASITDSASAPTITGLYRQFYGSTATNITTSSDVRGLSNSAFTNVNTISSVSITQLKFVIAIPSARNLLSVTTSNFENITSSFVETNFDVDDAGGNPVAYRIFTVSFFSVPSFTINIVLSN